LLLLAHPGHEFIVYEWIVASCPAVCILTDGSGMAGAPRIAQSKLVIQGLNARVGPVWGDASDRDFYRRILEQDHAFFMNTCERIVEYILVNDINEVVSDAIEGYEPTHDICEAIARAAVLRASQQSATRIHHYLIPILGNPGHAPFGNSSAAIKIELTCEQISRKRTAIAAYAKRAGTRLTAEIQDAYDRHGISAFDREYLFEAPHNGWQRWHRHFIETAPQYELRGRAHVASGRDQIAINYKDHVAPISERLINPSCAS